MRKSLSAIIPMPVLLVPLLAACGGNAGNANGCASGYGAYGCASGCGNRCP